MDGASYRQITQFFITTCRFGLWLSHLHVLPLPFFTLNRHCPFKTLSLISGCRISGCVGGHARQARHDPGMQHGLQGLDLLADLLFTGWGEEGWISVTLKGQHSEIFATHAWKVWKKMKTHLLFTTYSCWQFALCTNLEAVANGTNEH